jgi:hypothetical protein
MSNKIIANNKPYFNKTVLIFYYILSLALLSGIQAFGKGADYYAYIKIFGNSYNRSTLEPFYMLFRRVNDVLFSSSIFTIFFINALFALSIKLVAFKYLCKTYFDFLICLTFYFFAFFFIHDYVQIRASLAIAIFLWSIRDIAEGNLLKYCIKTILAVCCHTSAVVMLPFYIFCKIFTGKKALIILVSSSFLFSVFATKTEIINSINEIINFIIRISETKKGYKGVITVSAFNLKYLALLGLFIILYFVVDKKNKINITLYQSFAFGLTLFYFFLTLGFWVFAVRFAEFYSCVFIVLLANNIRHIKIKEKSFLYCMAYIFILLYFYATLKTIGLLGLN